MTPDWAARPTAVPYAPVNRVDADGHYCVMAGLAFWCSADNPPAETTKEANKTNKTNQAQNHVGIWGHLKNAFAQTTVKVTIGVGIGGKVKAGPGQVKLEAAAKANVAFSAGKVSVSKSVDIGATAGKWHKEFGLGASAEQVVGSVNVDTGERGGVEPATGETVVGGTTRTFGGNANQEGVEFGGEEGEGPLGGGSIFITKEGLGELREAWGEVRDAAGSALETVLTSPISN